jgi:hypothetical protein
MDNHGKREIFKVICHRDGRLYHDESLSAEKFKIYLLEEKKGGRTKIRVKKRKRNTKKVYQSI